MTTVLLHTGQTAPKVQAPRPRVQVVRGGRHGLNRARQLAASTVLVLNGQINAAKSDLAAAQSDYDYLASQMSAITSRTSLQQVAEGELGLVPADPSQVTYVELETESVIEKTGSDAAQALSDVGTAALSLLGSLDP